MEIRDSGCLFYGTDLIPAAFLHKHRVTAPPPSLRAPRFPRGSSGNSWKLDCVPEQLPSPAACLGCAGAGAFQTSPRESKALPAAPFSSNPGYFPPCEMWGALSLFSPPNQSSRIPNPSLAKMSADFWLRDEEYSTTPGCSGTLRGAQEDVFAEG